MCYIKKTRDKLLATILTFIGNTSCYTRPMDACICRTRLVGTISTNSFIFPGQGSLRLQRFSFFPSNCVQRKLICRNRCSQSAKIPCNISFRFRRERKTPHSMKMPTIWTYYTYLSVYSLKKSLARQCVCFSCSKRSKKLFLFVAPTFILKN